MGFKSRVRRAERSEARRARQLHEEISRECEHQHQRWMVEQGMIMDEKWLIVRQSDDRAVIETDDVEYAQRYADTYPGEYRVVQRKHFTGRVH